MRSSKLVLSCLILSCSALVIASATASGRAGSTASGASEPAASVTAAATLAGVFDTGHGPRARVRLTIVPHESDTTVSVISVTQEEAASLSSPAERPVLARASVAKGARRQLFVETDLEAGRDNHLFFLVSAKGKSAERQVVHLLVPLDSSVQPEVVGSHIQYQGAPAQGSQP